MIGPLLEWYGARIDGTWEHHYGFTIETADNPGLIVTVHSGDDLGPDRVLEERYAERSDRFAPPEADQTPVRQVIWDIRLRDGRLVGFCEPGLERALVAQMLKFLGPLT